MFTALHAHIHIPRYCQHGMQKCGRWHGCWPEAFGCDCCCVSPCFWCAVCLHVPFNYVASIKIGCSFCQFPALFTGCHVSMAFIHDVRSFSKSSSIACSIFHQFWASAAFVDFLKYSWVLSLGSFRLFSSIFCHFEFPRFSSTFINLCALGFHQLSSICRRASLHQFSSNIVGYQARLWFSRFRDVSSVYVCITLFASVCI